MNKEPWSVPLTRGQAVVVVAILLALYAFQSARTSRLEERDKQRSQEYNRVMDGVNRISNDMELLTKEIVYAKKETAP